MRAVRTKAASIFEVLSLFVVAFLLFIKSTWDHLESKIGMVNIKKSTKVTSANKYFPYTLGDTGV